MPENQLDIKPKNLKLHDFLVRKMAVKMMLPEKWIDTVISDEKKGINDAFKKHNQVEISGFGKFEISQVKLRKKIVICEKSLVTLNGRLKGDLDDPEEQDTLRKITSIQKELDYYKTVIRP